MLKVVLIDDEPRAIESLRLELEKFCPEVEVVSEFTDAREALVFFEKDNDIDCLFLDIEMPFMDGFRFLDLIPVKNFAVIFTTAFDQYGISAVKEQALDYLLKPIDSEDLIEAAEKIRRYKKASILQNKFKETVLNTKPQRELENNRIGLNVDGKIVFLKPEEVLYCEGDGNYSTVFLINGENLLLTKTLKKLAEKLNEDLFFRVHNSFIINLGMVREYLKVDAQVLMIDGKLIPVSRNRKTKFLSRFS